jgi:dihydrolipoamide dehydrogenase
VVVGELTEETQLVVLGGGPGGYVAAFRAADLGVQTTLIDASELLGGVCLREGCIPSKALLHVAHTIHTAHDASEWGVTFNKPKIDVDKLRGWKQKVVDRLCGGVKTLAGKRKVTVIHGRAAFEDNRTLRIESGDETQRLKFKHCIIATGSTAKRLPEKLMPADCCIDSTGALELENIPKTMLVVGGGYIGLELGQVYAALGTKVTVLEALDNLLANADQDLARVLVKQLGEQFAAVHTSAKLISAKKDKKGVAVTFQTKDGQEHTETFEKVLTSVGRQPTSSGIGLENTRVKVNDRGFIEINERMQTADKHIYAIGDVAGDPMLAHKASREGVVAAENVAGHDAVFDNRAIPAVVYTSPELAWVGLTENEAKAQGVEHKVGKFNWGASGRAIAMGRPVGLTKIITDADGRRILGVGIVGEHAGDLISEAALAIEMGAEAEDLALTIHPHPATSETVMEAAESVLGSAIHSLK